MSETVLSFVVPGKPAPAGSKRGFIYTPKGGGNQKVAMVPMSTRQVPYMASITAAAAEAMALCEWELMRGPVKLCVVITFVRPACHFGTGKNSGVLKSNAPEFPKGRPDSLKICRAVEDAMSGVVYRDDSQIVEHEIYKIYGDSECTVVRVWEL